MVNQKRLACNCCLLGAVAYGFISGSIGSGKNFGIASLVIYGVSGVVVIISECVGSDDRIRKVDTNVQVVKLFAALDLLTAEVIVSVGQFEMMYALLSLIPSALDLIFYIADSGWDSLTHWWHIVDVIIFIVFGIKDSKFILIPAAIFYLIAILGDGRGGNLDGCEALFEALGLFCASASIGGKDLQDFGIPIG